MKLVVFGGGDLAQRVLALLASVPTFREVVIVTGGLGAAEPLARLYGGCISANVRGAEVDWRDEGSVVALLDLERPDIIFHATAFVSPWRLSDHQTPVSEALAAAGFGIMLPAQLARIRMVMLALRALDLGCPVVNASYPDLTHPVLATEGLAPTIGVGNAGMMFQCILPELRAQNIAATPRLLAHHAQVTPFAQGTCYAPGENPWLFLGEEVAEFGSFVSGRLPRGRLLNALTAAHAVHILTALVDEARPLRTSAPGPLGMPGGWPVLITTEGVALDLPGKLDVAQASAYQNRAAVADGVEGIADDGTVHFTASARAALTDVAPDLADPFQAAGLTHRLNRLIEVVAM